MQPRNSLSLGAVLVFALSLAACEAPGPTAAGDDPRHSTINGVTLLTAPTSGRLTPAGQTSATIGLLGGAVAIDGGRLSVPAGALLLPRTITMEGKIEGRYQYRFGPSGLRFLVPAILTIAVDPEALGVSADRIGIAVASDGGDDWVIVGGTYDPLTGTVSAAVHHFSEYALCVN